MALQEWAVPELSRLLPLDNDSLKQIVSYTDSLPDAEAADHLRNLLGDSPQALEFITSFNQRRLAAPAVMSKQTGTVGDSKTDTYSQPSYNVTDSKTGGAPAYAPPPGPPPSHNISDSKSSSAPAFAPPLYPPPTQKASKALRRPHTNQVIEAATVRARDEQEMQNILQNLQMQYGIYNSEIEPEHETEYYCSCAIHNFQRLKYRRTPVQDMWSKAVMYPGEKAYTDNFRNTGTVFSNNPYRFRVISPYGQFQTVWGPQRPQAAAHAMFVQQTIQLNNSLNREAQASIDSKEPKVNIWNDEDLEASMRNLSVGGDRKYSYQKPTDEKRGSLVPVASNDPSEAPVKQSKLSSFRKSIGIKTTEERTVAKTEKKMNQAHQLKDTILTEEDGRWPDAQWQQIVNAYQEKVGMTRKIADLRERHPIQYLHLLRAGYFEPIPVAWAGSASNPLKFSIEAAVGWRGITPSWRGFEDTAEERLYWVLNHREGGGGASARMKPDFISALEMARARMASAVEPPPEYFSPNDTCHLQHTSDGYSKQVMPPPFQAYDRPEMPTDDTMILLDVSGSMDFDPVRPLYDRYLITSYTRSTQPKNKDVAKAIIRRFTDAMANHDHQFSGYDLVTFSSQATHIGTINHQNLDHMWRKVRLGGGTRVMTGWQKVKDLHFQKHSESATHHPIYGWQAGPETPMLRLLLLLDGEATDMDEFELDLLGLSWAHVTIFLIGVDGCPHHHRHANELQRISDVNHHVSFVDAQGNTPERFVTHELLKRHLGYNITMTEFEQMEELPAYTE